MGKATFESGLWIKVSFQSTGRKIPEAASRGDWQVGLPSRGKAGDRNGSQTQTLSLFSPVKQMFLLRWRTFYLGKFFQNDDVSLWYSSTSHLKCQKAPTGVGSGSHPRWREKREVSSEDGETIKMGFVRGK